MAAAVVFATSTGDVFVPAALVAVALSPWSGAAVGLAGAATVARWGTTDLGLVAGDQAVLGAAAATGPALAAVSSGLAGLAVLVAVAPATADRRPRVLVGAAGGAVLVAGPALSSAADAGLRLGALAVGLALAWFVTARGVARRIPPWLGAAVGAGAVAAAVAA